MKTKSETELDFTYHNLIVHNKGNYDSEVVIDVQYHLAIRLESAEARQLAQVLLAMAAVAESN